MFGTFITFLAAHADLVELLYNAITAGVPTQTLKDRIEAEMKMTSDTAIDVEFPGT